MLLHHIAHSFRMCCFAGITETDLINCEQYIQCQCILYFVFIYVVVKKDF